MKFIRAAIALMGVVLMSACGGGGNDGDSTPTATPPLNVTLAASSSSASATEGTTNTIATVTATVSGTTSAPVVANLTYDTNIYSSVSATPGTTAGTYVISLTTLPDLAVGDYASPITFRLCRETACTNVYPGSTVTYTLNLSVKLQDWVTFQRNAAHTGYVHATLDSTKFTKAWTWSNPDRYTLGGVISSNGNAYVSSMSTKVYSFNEANGAVNWGRNVALAPPGEMTFDKDTLYVPGALLLSSPGMGGAIRGVDPANGDIKTTSQFASQIKTFNSPTIINSEMFYSQGASGGVMHKYSLPAGNLLWQTAYSLARTHSGVSPAVDQNYVYSSTGFGVEIYNRSDGSTYAKISDALTSATTYTDLISPVIAPSGRVIVGNPQGGYQLIAIDVPSKSIVWRTGTNYNLQPVVANGVVYGSRNTPFGVDAINEADGTVMWSWTLPATDTKLIGNMIVCDNLLFVSSDKAIYAIDLKTHMTVWTYAEHGRLSLSSSYMLYIANGDVIAGSSVMPSVTAIKLK